MGDPFAMEYPRDFRKLAQFMRQFLTDRMAVEQAAYELDKAANALDAIDAALQSRAQAEAPGMTDLMVPPESIDSWLENNPLPADAEADPSIVLWIKGDMVCRDTILNDSAMLKDGWEPLYRRIKYTTPPAAAMVVCDDRANGNN